MLFTFQQYSFWNKLKTTVFSLEQSLDTRIFQSRVLVMEYARHSFAVTGTAWDLSDRGNVRRVGKRELQASSAPSNKQGAEMPLSSVGRLANMPREDFLFRKNSPT
ncbi:hypothetical protein AVEN_61700-1 [Araneus ventricosus]|uniref:Uncharacterized protein n=1 Tax=Araneus ventricosus TaxID=182803 RepID=A0A4Y2T4K5_ARAVE|nr:hypothetical protein AVEN_61700-1 [Araneus ventricosus]